MNGQNQYAASGALTSEATRGGELASRLDGFRQEVRALGPHPSRADVERLLAVARDLHLRDEDLHEELSELLAGIETLDFADRIAREGLPVVEAPERLPPEEQPHFVTPVRFGRRRSDQCGHLELTNARLRFHGALDVGVAWSEVAAVERTGHEILVSLASSRKLLRFSCYAATEAARGTLIARHLASHHAAT